MEQGHTHNAPSQNMPAMVTLRRVAIFRFRITGKGKQRTRTSKTMLIPANASAKSL